MIKKTLALSAIALLAISATAFAGTSLDVYFDGGTSVALDRGYLNINTSCQSTDVATCRVKVTLTSKSGKKIGTANGESTAGNAAGVSIKVPSKYKGAKVKACAKETSTGAKDCSSIKIKK